MIPAVAAGHPATAEAGAEILADGGTAADAAVAASLASCVAETVMTGFLGGGHAVYLDAGTGAVRNLDCFVAVPSGSGAPMEHLQIRFGEELVDYAFMLFVAGLDTVTAMLGFTFYCLATRPDIRARLVAEPRQQAACTRATLVVSPALHGGL